MWKMADAADLMPVVYDELRRLAGAQLRGQASGHTLQATALVNEAYLKLAGHPNLEIGNRQEFLLIAGRVMRNVLVDHARARDAVKRGGGWQRLTLSAAFDDGSAHQLDVLALNEALTELTTLNERMGRLVELRFFCGLDENEAAEVLGVSRAAVSRDWRMARAWLAHKLRDGEGEG
jgi:RNA polymerase sigma factor (TIGR02999 family)